MPRLLKAATIRRIDASKRALRLALAGLAFPRHLPKDRPAENAAELGLIGSAAVLALSACIVESAGEAALVRNRGMFYSATEVLVVFRRTLRNPSERPESLFVGVTDPEIHAAEIVEAIRTFGPLFEWRAAALHSGMGVSRDVCYAVANDVATFLLLLGKSPRWKPYLADVAQCPPLPKSKRLLVEELAKILGKTASGSKAKVAIGAIFLLAPELPSEQPEWVRAMKNLMVAPGPSDLTILVKSLERAQVGELYKGGESAESLAVRVDNTDPDAIRVNSGNFSTSFKRPANQIQAFAGSANSSSLKDA